MESALGLGYFAIILHPYISLFFLLSPPPASPCKPEKFNLEFTSTYGVSFGPILEFAPQTLEIGRWEGSLPSGATIVMQCNAI